MELTGTVAIVTGAGRGIGRATALALARRGVVVVLVARTQPEVESVAGEAEATGSTALPIVADVGREDEVAGMVDRTLQTYGRVDILVNNAG
ncbi:MAG: putative ketoreductase, partial [candidate division NC10 bacterium]|nr:putative ketoreductase [candidate division NC10 bacterium]